MKVKANAVGRWARLGIAFLLAVTSGASTAMAQPATGTPAPTVVATQTVAPTQTTVPATQTVAPTPAATQTVSPTQTAVPAPATSIQLPDGSVCQFAGTGATAVFNG